MGIARWRSVIAVVLVFSLIGTSLSFAAGGDPFFDERPGVTDQEPTGGEMLLDVALVRPISFLGLIVGCVTWVVATPLALIADGADGFDAVSNKLVVVPAKYTFVRTVGEL